MRHKAQKGKESSWIVDIIVALLVEICSAFFSHILGRELPFGIFCAVMSFMIVVLIYWGSVICRRLVEKVKGYRTQIKKLEQKAKCDEEVEKSYYFKQKQLRLRLLQSCKKTIGNIVRKRWKIILFAITAIVTLSFFNPQNAHAYWGGIGVFIGIGKVPKATEEQSLESSASEEMSEKSTVQEEHNEEPIITERNYAWRFILDTPNSSISLEGERAEQVFFDLEMMSSEWENEILEVVDKWQKNPRKGVEYTTIKDEMGNNYYTYTSKEDNFKKKVQDAAQYIELDEWIAVAPHSSEQEVYITGRETLNCIKEDGEEGCYELWWLLANDYQYYAQEYEYQTKNGDAILYYYVNSIYCCMEALQYAIDEEEYQETYHYMVMRYHDMFRDDCNIDEKYKEKAAKIYFVLVKKDVLSYEKNVQ